jgi:hypothetical protein
MELREEILQNSGFSSDQILLTEGIRFFKHSKRLKKFAGKIMDKVGKYKGVSVGSETKRKLVELAKRINNAATDFEKLEIKFTKATGPEKKELKNKYKTTKDKYVEILKLLRKEEVKKALKVIGVAGLVAGVVVLLLNLLATNAVGTAAMYIANGQAALPKTPGEFDALLKAAQAGEESAKRRLAALNLAGGGTDTGIIGGVSKFFNDTKDWFGERGADVVQWWSGKRPTTSFQEKQNIIETMKKMTGLAKEQLETQLNGSKAINIGLAAAGGITTAGALGLFNKIFKKAGKNKLVRDSRKVLEDLSSVEVTTSKQEKTKAKGEDYEREEKPKSSKTVKVER